MSASHPAQIAWAELNTDLRPYLKTFPRKIVVRSKLFEKRLRFLPRFHMFQSFELCCTFFVQSDSIGPSFVSHGKRLVNTTDDYFFIMIDGRAKPIINFQREWVSSYVRWKSDQFEYLAREAMSLG